MITQTTKLGGRLVKWALKKKDGHYVERNCNVHNTITKACINNMLEFNGPGSHIGSLYGNLDDARGVNLFVTGSGNNGRYGVFNSCALGNGTGETSVNDTDLKNKIGNYTVTKWSGYCSSSINSNTNKLYVRIAHIHIITDNFTIKEIGWFNRVYPDGEYSLSSRVQLDEFVDVEVGDTFYTVYELVIQFMMPKDVILPYLGKARALGKLYGANTYYGQNYPSIRSNGVGLGIDYYMSDACPCNPAYCFESNYNISEWGGPIKYCSTNTNIDSLNSSPSLDNAGIISKSVSAYTLDSFYRDMEFSITAPGTTVYAFVCNNTIYRLGEYDENSNFVPNPYDGSKGLKFTIRQRISTDLLTPAA